MNESNYKTLLEVIMETKKELIKGINNYIKENPKERPEILETLKDIVTKLKNRELEIIDLSLYIKEIKDAWNVAVYQIVFDIYRKLNHH